MLKFSKAGLSASLIAVSLVLATLTPVAAFESDDSPGSIPPAPEVPISTAPGGSEPIDASEELALAAETGQSVAVDETITPSSQILALPNGSMQYEVSSVPVRTEDADGRWAPIDTNLVLRDGWWEPTASATPVRFASGGTSDLSEVRTPSGDWLAESWPHGALPAPRIDGPTATYVGVFPGVDLKLTATDLGMASVYVIKSASAATSEVLTDLHVVLEGAEVTKEVEGTFTAESASGDTITASSPLWWDSSDGGTYVSPGDTNPAMPVSHTFTDEGVQMDVPETIERHQPTYPIFIDPDWSVGPYAAWYTDAAYPNQSYLSAGQSDILRVGRFNPYRGNMFFQFVISALAGKQILGAQLSTTQLKWAACPNSPLQVRTFGPQTAGFTWNQQNHGAWGPVLDTKNPGSCSSGPETVGWNVGAGVQASVGQVDIQFGFAPQDENAQSRRHFSRSATLTVQYNSPPDTPTSLQFTSPQRSCGTASAPAIISATDVTVSFWQTDPDAGNVDTNVDLHKTSDLSNRVQWQHPGLGAQGTKTVTFTGLIDGQAYAWRSRGSDWVVDGAYYSSWCYFTIDRTGPAVPTLNPPTTTPVVGKPATFSFSTLPADKVAFIAYSVMPSSAASGFVFDVFGSPPVCNSTIGLIRIACPDAAGSASVTLAPTDSVSTLLAVPYDVAGNPGVIPGTPAGQAGKVGASYQMNATNDPLVKFVAAHAWMTQVQQSPLGASIPDTNPTKVVPLALGRDALRTLTANPISPSIPLGKAVLGFRDPATIVSAPGNAFVVSTVSPATGALDLWTCNSAGNLVTGSATLCDELAPGAPRQRVGYTWPSAKATGSAAATPLFACDFSETVLLVKAVPNANCATPGQASAGTPLEQIGYVFPAVPTGADATKSVSTAVAPVTSFTVAAWLKPGTGGGAAAVSTSTSAAGWELGATADQWRFCLHAAPPASAVCAVAPRAANADWTHIAGVWDATNGQLRLYINASSAALVAFTWPSGTATTTLGINVGAEAAGTVVTSRWTGLIADPSVFPGVATSSQLSLLRSGQDPVNG